MNWFVYVLWSTRIRRSYVGIAVDPERRLRQHNGEIAGGARNTRAGRPWSIRISYGPFEDRSAAQRAEHAVKQLRGEERWLAENLTYLIAQDLRSPGPGV